MIRTGTERTEALQFPLSSIEKEEDRARAMEVPPAPIVPVDPVVEAAPIIPPEPAMTAATNIVVSADAAAVSRVVGIQEETEEEAARRKKQRIGVKDGTGVDGVALGSPPGGAQGLTDEMLRKAVETVVTFMDFETQDPSKFVPIATVKAAVCGVLNVRDQSAWPGRYQRIAGTKGGTSDKLFGEMIRECVKARLQALGGSTTEWTPRWKDNKLVIGSGPGGKKGRVYSCGFSEEGLSYAQRSLQM